MLEYICDDCSREITEEEYSRQSNDFCPKCGGDLEKNITKVWSFLGKDKQTRGLVCDSVVKNALREKIIDEETNIFNAYLSEHRSLKDWKQFDLVAEIDAIGLESHEVPIESIVKNTKLLECESCGQLFSKRAAKCPKCDCKPLKYCQICHRKIPVDSSSCPECGDPDPFNNIEIEKRSNSHTNSEGKPRNSARGYENPRSPEQELHSRNTKKSIQPSVKDILFSFEGRITRKHFWLYGIVGIWIPLICLFIYYSVYPDNDTVLYVFLCFSMLALWPLLAIQIKRWHDRNKSGYWVLLNCIPIIGTVWPLIELGFFQGTTGPNSYGDDPLSSAMSSVMLRNA